MTNNKRYTVPVSRELEMEITNLRKTDKYCTMSFAEILRQLLMLGLECVKVDE